MSDGDILVGKVSDTAPDIELSALSPYRRGGLVPSDPGISDIVEPSSRFPRDDDPWAAVMETFESEPAGFGRGPRCLGFLVPRVRDAGVAVDAVDEPDQVVIIVEPPEGHVVSALRAGLDGCDHTPLGFGHLRQLLQRRT